MHWNVFEKILIFSIFILICGIISLVVFAPLGTWIGNALNVFIKWALDLNGAIGGFLLGSLHLVMVLTGSHFIEIPLIMQEFSSSGGTAIMAITSMGNTALVGSLIALLIKTKNAKKRGEYTSMMVPTVMGITEPILYGISLRYKIVLISGMIGGGIAGAILGASGFLLKVMGIPGIFAPLGNLTAPAGIWYLISTLVAITVAFAITFIFYKPDKKAL